MTPLADLSGLMERLREMCRDWDHSEMNDLAEPRYVPTCGELRTAADTLSAMQGRIEELEGHIREQITHAETRIKDGDEIGARVWRIALTEMAQESRAVLAQGPTP